MQWPGAEGRYSGPYSISSGFLQFPHPVILIKSGFQVVMILEIVKML